MSSRRLVTYAECLPCTRHHAGCSPSHPKGHGCLPQTRDEVRKADKLVLKRRLIQKKTKKHLNLDLLKLLIFLEPPVTEVEGGVDITSLIQNMGSSIKTCPLMPQQAKRLAKQNKTKQVTKLINFKEV